MDYIFYEQKKRFPPSLSLSFCNNWFARDWARHNEGLVRRSLQEQREVMKRREFRARKPIVIPRNVTPGISMEPEITQCNECIEREKVPLITNSIIRR